MGNILRTASMIYVIFVFVFLLGPFFIILSTSFSKSMSLSFPPSKVSVQWYERFIDHLAEKEWVKPGLGKALLTSAGVGAATSIITLVGGVFAGFVFARARWRGRDILRQVFVLPIIFPQIVIAIALLLFFSSLKLFTTEVRMIIGHVTICLPFVLLIVSANFESYDKSIEEAALGLGAGPMRTFFQITLPLIQPALVAAGIFAFIISFTNFTISFFLAAGGVKTLPILVIEVMEHLLDPVLAVISVFLITTVALTAFVIDRLVGISQIIRS